MTNANGEFSCGDGVPLKEHFTSMLGELDKRIEQARTGMEKRLDITNEWRSDYEKMVAKFPTKSEITIELDSMKNDIKTLLTFKDTQAGKASVSALYLTLFLTIVGLALSICGIMVAVLSMWMRLQGL